MNRPISVWGAITVAVFIVALIIAGLVLIIGLFKPGPELTIGLIVVLGVSALVVLLFIMAAGFAALNMGDKGQAMGLPEGSIRAMIALFLIVVWVILSVFLFNVIGNQTTDTAGTRLAQQLFTTMGTLVVAVASFYFGSRSVASARAALAPSTAKPTSQPAIWKIDQPVPPQGTPGTTVSLTIQGKNFRMPKSVRLVQNTTTMEATDIISSDTQIQCKFTIPANQKVGKWDLIVVNEDGGQDQLTGAFEVMAHPGSPAASGTPTPGT